MIFLFLLIIDNDNDRVNMFNLSEQVVTFLLFLKQKKHSLIQ